MLSASRLAWRTACCALGAVVAPVVLGQVGDGGAGRRRPRRRACPRTCRVASHSTRPRPSTGRSVSASIGLGFVPAVQTRVSAGELLAVAEPDHAVVGDRLQPGVRAARPCPRAVSCLTVQARHVQVDLRAGSGPSPRRAPSACPTATVAGSSARWRTGPCPPARRSASTPAYPPPTNDEGERPPPDRGVVGGAGRVEPGQHVVAQEDRLTDVLEADAVLGQPRDRQRPRHRAGRHHEHVVGHLERRALDGRDPGPLVRVRRAR